MVAKEVSDFDREVSATGPIGVLQLRPTTAAREFGVDPNKLRDPVTDVRLGLGLPEPALLALLRD
ncbi:MAG: hypothetical protein OXQ31_03945 [Spirochaetaceae bacterium]|nr:hypothetical protein [Spirochaetaceae bacterium]